MRRAHSLLARTLLIFVALLPTFSVGAPVRADKSSLASTVAAANSTELAGSSVNAAGGVVARAFDVSGRVIDYTYLPSVDLTDQTVVVITSSGEVWITHDQGTNWEQDPLVTGAVMVFPHPKVPSIVFVAGSDGKVYVTRDRAKSFELMDLPAEPNYRVGSRMFDSDDANNVMIFNGVVCDDPGALDCPAQSFYSVDSGRTWKPLLENTSQCMLAGQLQQPSPPNLVYCRRDEAAAKPGELVYTVDWGKTWVSAFDRVYGVANDEPFLIAGVVTEGGESEAWVSANGVNWARAVFPLDASIDSRAGFTVLSSETKSVFLFASSSNRNGREFGPLMKSNYNGTNFVTTLADVNRNGVGYVDFERIKSVEGLALANVVANSKDVYQSGAAKIIQTRITHSDGAFWDPLPVPEGSVCDNPEKCWLHLHGYTERIDVRNGPSSKAAVGVIISQGNIGAELLGIRESSTFMSRDGGISWQEVAKGPNLWEFGDSGSIIVLVDADDPTSTIRYTTNEGNTWNEFQFSEEPVRVHKLATIPSDSSRKFVMFVQPPAARGDVTQMIQIDFSELTKRQCRPGDFEPWVPQHPNLETECLFGHITQYLRKKVNNDCYVGYNADLPLGEPHKVLQTCECTELDYECDINYQRAADGTCRAVDGLESSPNGDMNMQCLPGLNSGVISWHHNTGYRRIPISTCQGGKQLDDPQEFPCPGMDNEFGKLPHPGPPGSGGGRSFLGTLFLVLFIIGVLVCLGIVAARFSGVIGDSSSFSFSKFFAGHSGGIRLGGDDEELPLTQKILHGALDVAATTAGAAVSAWQFVSQRIFSRSPSDNMGYYTRMDDEERYRILEFEDEEEGGVHDHDFDDDEPGHQDDHELIDDDELRQHV